MSLNKCRVLTRKISFFKLKLTAVKKVKHACMKCRKEICNNTGDSKKASTVWHTGYPVCSCGLLIIYRAEC